MNAAEWLREWAVVGQTYALDVRASYWWYLNWCKDTGARSVAVGPFSQYLSSRGLQKTRERSGADRIWRYVGTLLEEESNVLDGVSQAADSTSERERRASVEVVGVDIGVVFEVDHCLIRVPACLYGSLGRVLQILAHDAEPTEPVTS